MFHHMKKLLLSSIVVLLTFATALAQVGIPDFEAEYVKKNLIKRVKTTYEYYESSNRGKTKKKDLRIGKVIYTYDDDGRISRADFFYADGKPSNRDEYTYGKSGIMTSVKKVQIMTAYDKTTIEKVYHYEFIYKGNGEMDHCDLNIYDVRNGKKGYGSKKRIEKINIYYPSCFKQENADQYKRDNKGLITEIASGKDEVQTFEYEFF